MTRSTELLAENDGSAWWPQTHLAFDAGSATFCGLVGKRLLDAPPQTPTSMLRCTINFALHARAGEPV